VDLTPKQFGEFLNNRQPQSGASELAGQTLSIKHFVALTELLKDDGLILPGNPNSGIADQKFESTIVQISYRNSDHSTFGCNFDRVAQQVVQNLTQFIGVLIGLGQFVWDVD